MKSECVKFIGGQKDEFLKGWHAFHPILPDDTLCSVAVSDNEEGFEVEIKEANVTCESCLKIIRFCKSIKTR